MCMFSLMSFFQSTNFHHCRTASIISLEKWVCMGWFMCIAHVVFISACCHLSEFSQACVWDQCLESIYTPEFWRKEIILMIHILHFTFGWFVFTAISNIHFIHKNCWSSFTCYAFGEKLLKKISTECFYTACLESYQSCFILLNWLD